MVLKAQMAAQVQSPFRVKKRKIHNYPLSICVSLPLRKCSETTSLVIQLCHIFGQILCCFFNINPG